MAPDSRHYRTSLRVTLDPALPVERARRARTYLGARFKRSRSIPGWRQTYHFQDVAGGAAVYAVRFMVPDYGRGAWLSRYRWQLDLGRSTAPRRTFQVARAAHEVHLARTAQGT